MVGPLDVEKSIHEYFEHQKIFEFLFFSIGRQGGRTALEILARALISEGKHVYIGQNLAGERSMGTNNMMARFSEKADIPTTISVLNPKGLMFMHEALIWSNQGSSLQLEQLNRTEVVSQFRSGILMICTSKAPEEVEYPLDFEGTVATVDAEAIFTERVSIKPPPSGITSLGLFVAATGNLVSLETVKKAILEHERIGQRARELNVECMQKAYEMTRVLPNRRIKGKYTLEEYQKLAEDDPLDFLITPEKKVASILWRESLPVCDVRKCVCIECLAAYYCPEGAISWKDESYNVDYTFCKGCGTCALECPEKAITMEDAEKAMAKVAKSKKPGR